MLNSVHGQSQAPVTTNATQTEFTAKAPVPQPKAPPAQSSLAANTVSDSVHISNAAKALLQEATETKTQTAQEALKGDAQAQRLLARESQAAPSRKK